MGDSDTIDRLIAVGRPDLAERLKHLAGKHNQARHGWRFAKGGDDAARLGAARRSMRGRDAGERAEYRKRAGMPEAKRLERKRPAQQEEELASRVSTINGERLIRKSDATYGGYKTRTWTILMDSTLPATVEAREFGPDSYEVTVLGTGGGYSGIPRRAALALGDILAKNIIGMTKNGSPSFGKDTEAVKRQIRAWGKKYNLPTDIIAG